ncbi:MAG: hypothetical protein KGL39_49915 [Patescibacteria group bacterium]|nr:hypothetical protein [Patescibacteria group bacterium]
MPTKSKRKVPAKKLAHRFQVGLFFYYHTGEVHYWWSNALEQWRISATNDPWPDYCNITEREARKRFPEAFKAGLPK